MNKGKYIKPDMRMMALDTASMIANSQPLNNTQASDSWQGAKENESIWAEPSTSIWDDDEETPL